MRKLLILAAVAAVSAACHNRNEDEVGAAPNQGRTDTTAVTHVLDSTRTGPPGVGGRPGNATINADSVGLDSSAVRQGGADTTSAGPRDSSTVSAPQDTLGPRSPGAGAIDSSAVKADTSTMRSDTGSLRSDSTTSDSTKNR